jgi:hypothetical protein
MSINTNILQKLNHIMRERSSQIKSELKDLENNAAGLGIGSGLPNRRTTIKPEALAPSKDFTVPSSSFFFADQPPRASITQFLPAKPVADRLLNQYWEGVHHVARVVHKQTTMRQWNQFWECIHSGIEPPASFQALVMGILLSAIISMTEEAVAYEFGAVKSQLMDSFRQGTETALSKANFLRTTKLQTLQALVMYLVRILEASLNPMLTYYTGSIVST